MIGKGFIEMLTQTEDNKKINNFSFKGTIFEILVHATS